MGTFLLHSLITNNERGIPAIPRQVLVDGNWVDGPSLPDLDPVEGDQSNKARAI